MPSIHSKPPLGESVVRMFPWRWLACCVAFALVGGLAGTGFFPWGTLMGVVVGGSVGLLPGLLLAIASVVLVWWGQRLGWSRLWVGLYASALPALVLLPPALVIRQADGGPWFSAATLSLVPLVAVGLFVTFWFADKERTPTKPKQA